MPLELFFPGKGRISYMPGILENLRKSFVSLVSKGGPTLYIVGILSLVWRQGPVWHRFLRNLRTSKFCLPGEERGSAIMFFWDS